MEREWFREVPHPSDKGTNSRSICEIAACFMRMPRSFRAAITIRGGRAWRDTAAPVRERRPNVAAFRVGSCHGFSAGPARVVDGGGPRRVSLLFSPGGFERRPIDLARRGGAKSLVFGLDRPSETAKRAPKGALVEVLWWSWVAWWWTKNLKRLSATTAQGVCGEVGTPCAQRRIRLRKESVISARDLWTPVISPERPAAPSQHGGGSDLSHLLRRDWQPAPSGERP